MASRRSLAVFVRPAQPWALAAIALALAIGCGYRPDEGAGTRFDPVGTYVHADSGVSFPETVAGFVRKAPRRYDEEGRDVGIGYERTVDGRHLEATVYVYPPPRSDDGTVLSPEMHYAEEVMELRKGKTGLRDGPRAETDATHGGRTVRVQSAEFEFRGRPPHGTGKRDLATLLASCRMGAWHMTVRATVDREVRDAAWAAVEELLAALGLPPTGLAGSKPPPPGAK